MKSFYLFFVLGMLTYSPYLFSQANDYVPQFEPLKSFPEAPSELLRKLDHIFSNKEIIEFKNTSDLDLYVRKKTDTFAIELLEINDSSLRAPYARIQHNILEFDKGYAYKLNGPKEKFSIGGLGYRISEEEYLSYINKFGEVRNSHVTWVDKRLNPIDISQYLNTNEHNKINNNFGLYLKNNKALAFDPLQQNKITLNQFIIEPYSTYDIPPVFIKSSIVAGRLRANYIESSIVKDGYHFSYNNFYNIKDKLDLEYKNYPYGDFVVIQDSYLKKYFLKANLKYFSITGNSKVKELEIESDSLENIWLGRFNHSVVDDWGQLLVYEKFPNSENIHTIRYDGDIYNPSENQKWGRVEIWGTNSRNIYINNETEILDLNYLVLSDELSISKRADTIILWDIKANKISIDFEQPDTETTTKISLKYLDYDKLDFRWKGFELFMPEDYNDEDLVSAYRRLLNSFRKKGLDDSYEILDIQYKQWNYRKKNKKVINWIQKNWWNYGYNKSLIFRNTAIIFFFFVLINLFFLRKFSSLLYEDRKVFKFANGNRRKFKNLIRYSLSIIPASIFFTARIFFGVGFKYDKLKYEKRLGFDWKIIGLVYFFAVFLSGLICLAYIANYVVTI